MAKLLIVDDDAQLRSALSTFLRRQGHNVLEAGDCREARRLDQHENPDLLVVDYQLPDGDAFDLLTAVRERDPEARVIVLTGVGTIELAVRAIKSGAEHFLTKPVDVESLEVLVRRTLEGQRERRQRVSTEHGRSRLNPFVGKSRAITELERLSRVVLGSEAPVLILGETGTGKGVLAHFLHDGGPRGKNAFVDLNCAGFSRELVEAELFGYQRGAFTGAVSHKPGLIEAADKGSLFLDEIGDLELAVQPKLLKAVEEKTFRRIGELSTRSADVRLIAATHRNLAALVREERFREDLLFRINTLTLEIPPLRERLDDMAELAHAVLVDICARVGRRIPEIAPEAMELLRAYAWPGNLRELRNVLERALLFCGDGAVLDKATLRFDRALVDEEGAAGLQTLDEAEKRHITRVLRQAEGRVDQAAKLLGLSRSSLYAKLRKYGIRASTPVPMK
jgi:DNA-binding NtrC family response regulator